ncbi:MAG: hypothetical protein PHR06_15310, partial [Candidatus Cloacimonetes bacterium]|nr:hypothetical protein [Candidatus Cloacimonadota bacterium]
MKNYLMILVLFAGVLNAQFIWQENGLPIRQTVLCDTLCTKDIVDSGEYSFWVWSDIKTGDYDIYLQKFDSEGNLLWQDGGLPLTASPDLDFNPQIIMTSDDKIIISWQTLHYSANYSNYHRAMKLDLEGNILWNTMHETEIVTHPTRQVHTLLANDNGGAFIIFKRNQQLLGMNLDQDGNSIWGETSVAILDAVQEVTSASINYTADDGLVIFFEDNDSNLKITRIAADGSPIWNEQLIINNLAGNKDFLSLQRMSDNSYLCFWRDYRTTQRNIYTQKFNIDGEVFLEPNGLQIIENEADANFLNTVKTSDDGVIVQRRNYNEFFLAKVDTNGDLLWNNQYSIDNPMAKMAVDYNGGIYTFSRGYSVDLQVQLCLHHFDSNGTITTPEAGISLTGIISDYNDLDVNAVFSDNLFITWNYFTNEGGIRLQLLDQQDNILLEEGGRVVTFGATSSNYNSRRVSNFNNSSYITWKDNSHNSSYLYLQIINEIGNLIFPENGKKILSTEDGIENYQIEVLADGNFLIIYKSDDDIYATAFDNEANPLWESPLLMNETPLYQDSKIILTRTGENFCLGWTETDFTMHSRIINMNGDISWDSSIHPISTEPGILLSIVDRYYIWMNNQTSELYVKLFSDEGNTAEGWNENGICFYTEQNFSTLADAQLTGNNLLVIWQYINTQNINSLRGQIISECGELDWQDNGIVLSENFDNVSNYIELF